MNEKFDHYTTNVFLSLSLLLLLLPPLRSAVCNALSLAASLMFTLLCTDYLYGIHYLVPIMNSSLAGLVAVTGCGAFITPGWSILIGVLSSIFYQLSSSMVVKMGIDDPVDAFAVHGACGLLGMFVVLFRNPEEVKMFYGVEAPSLGKQFVAQLVASLILIVMAIGVAVAVWLVCKLTYGIRYIKKNIVTIVVYYCV